MIGEEGEGGRVVTRSVEWPAGEGGFYARYKSSGYVPSNDLMASRDYKVI